MNFSGISSQTLLGHLLRAPLQLIPREACLPVLQGRLRGKKWIVGSSNHGCWLGSFEHEKRLLFERTVEPGAVVFDIGANVGFYTLLASVAVGPEGKVYAFEPAPRSLRYLREHLRLNAVSNVNVLEVAVSDHCGRALFDEGQNSALGHLSSSGQVWVETVGLDDLVATAQVPPPDYVKIDIEGAEFHALSGAKSMLASVRPTIFLSTHSPDLHRACRRLLESLGYTLRAIGPASVDETDELIAEAPRDKSG